jgi:hypothetical protein
MSLRWNAGRFAFGVTRTVLPELLPAYPDLPGLAGTQENDRILVGRTSTDSCGLRGDHGDNTKSISKTVDRKDLRVLFADAPQKGSHCARRRIPSPQFPRGLAMRPVFIDAHCVSST